MHITAFHGILPYRNGYSSLPHISVIPRFSEQMELKYAKIFRINGVKVCPSVYQLLLAHSSSILIHANRENALQLQGILNLYEQCSGQIINNVKSAFFSVSTQKWKCNKVAQALAELGSMCHGVASPVLDVIPD